MNAAIVGIAAVTAASLLTGYLIGVWTGNRKLWEATRKLAEANTILRAAENKMRTAERYLAQAKELQIANDREDFMW